MAAPISSWMRRRRIAGFRGQFLSGTRLLADRLDAECGVVRGDGGELGQGCVPVDGDVRPGSGYRGQIPLEDRCPLADRHLDQAAGPGLAAVPDGH